MKKQNAWKMVTILQVALVIMGSSQAEKTLSKNEVLDLCHQNDVNNIVSIMRNDDYWEVRGVNACNDNDCYLKVNAHNGCIESAFNVTPEYIQIDQNKYAFSGNVFKSDNSYFFSGNIVNGFKIYKNEDVYFRMRRAIFIQNQDSYVAYYIYQGPDVIK